MSGGVAFQETSKGWGGALRSTSLLGGTLQEDRKASLEPEMGATGGS